MNKKIEKILKIWHKHFESEENQYLEFENSDIEYFVGCMLYNHFQFIKALDTMKTIDLSYDFLNCCGDEYDEIVSIINTISLENEEEKINFLKQFIVDAKSKYNEDELYLLNRLEYHLNGVEQRFLNDEDTKKVDFVAPVKKSTNPLLK